jgi:hypothetical protein
VFDATFDEVLACNDGADPLVPPGYNTLIGASTVSIQLYADGDIASPVLVDCAQ